MAKKSSPRLKTAAPKNAFKKPLHADVKQLLKALSKGVGHTAVGKWEELGNDTVEALSSLGLATEPAELAFLLLRRGLTKALFDLLGESATQQLLEAKPNLDALIESLEISAELSDVQLDKNFLDRPGALQFIVELQPILRQWLVAHGANPATAGTIAARLPTYFIYSLNQEWRRNAKTYRPLLDALDTPFTRAGDREWAWSTYAALLHRRIQEGVFDEPFSLSQIYVPLNASYLAEPSRADKIDTTRGTRNRPKVAVELEGELTKWLESKAPQDAIRVLSGGPGSGKSSFARLFAAKTSARGGIKVLFVPLHLIDPAKELVEEVGRYVRDEGILLQNPLDPESPEPNLLIIFDGLDELASQGKAAAETARAFVREVERTVERRNSRDVKLRVVISGRELVVQENESEFRQPKQILTLLSYYAGETRRDKGLVERDGEMYRDPENLLKQDLRQKWWRNYGVLTGKGYGGLPRELDRDDLLEVTAQPLLNYLVALSFTREKLDFSKDINLNSVYADLVAAVHERAYEKRRSYGPIRHMNADDFTRVLEEVGLAAWHGDGRTTTAREIEEHCRVGGLGTLLDVFQEGAKAGVTRLLAAFFFRQHGQRQGGEPTFVFTHKSFGEYLTARRVVRAAERVMKERTHRSNSPDAGWDERDALKHWAQICGPSAVSLYLHVFLINELRLRPTEELARWREGFASLLSHVIRFGMPMEQLQITPFKEALFQSRNAEEALLVVLNTCARQSKQVSRIETSDPAAFGSWFRRIQGQRTGPESVLAARCLSHLDLQSSFLDIGDFYNADFTGSNLSHVPAHYACFGNAIMEKTDLRKALLTGAYFENANLTSANLAGAQLEEAHLDHANLEHANLEKARLSYASLVGVNLRGANLKGADLRGADLRGAVLTNANLTGANLKEALKGDETPAKLRAREEITSDDGGRVPEES